MSEKAQSNGALGPIHGRPSFRERFDRSRFPEHGLGADEVYELLERHGTALVVADRAPRGASPLVPTTSWRYLRFHVGRGRDGGYTTRQLDEWASRIEALDGDVYAYFNNDWRGLAVRDAARLRELLGEAMPRRGGLVEAGRR